MPPEQSQTQTVRGQRQHADHADGFEHRNMRNEHPVCRLPEHEQAERSHDSAFDERRDGLHLRAARDNVKTEAVHQRVAQHIERIGHQRNGTGQQAGDKLDRKHRGVDEQYRFQRRTLPVAKRFDFASRVAAAIRHVYSKLLNHRCTAHLILLCGALAASGDLLTEVRHGCRDAAIGQAAGGCAAAKARSAWLSISISPPGKSTDAHCFLWRTIRIFASAPSCNPISSANSERSNRAGTPRLPAYALATIGFPVLRYWACSASNCAAVSKSWSHTLRITASVPELPGAIASSACRPARIALLMPSRQLPLNATCTGNPFSSRCMRSMCAPSTTTTGAQAASNAACAALRSRLCSPRRISRSGKSRPADSPAARMMAEIVIGYFPARFIHALDSRFIRAFYSCL